MIKKVETKQWFEKLIQLEEYVGVTFFNKL